MLRSLSLLRVTRAVCFESSYLPKIASCSQHQFSLQNHSLPSFPPQRARRILLTKKSSPAARHHPCPPSQSPTILSPSGYCKSMGCFGQAGEPKQLRGSQGDMTRTELIAEPHRPLFKLVQPSFYLLPMTAQSLGKQFMSWWRKASPSSFLFSSL